ncbi:MAG: Rieske (2Fe-2S) protein [Pseudomonadota bacterium]
MSVAYIPVQWTRNKWFYDLALIALAVGYLLAFLVWGNASLDHGRPLDTQILRMRAFGSCAFFMLSAILCIGPLARLDRRWLPLLYNRRHFGVLTAAVALAHAGFVLDWYFAFSPVEPWVAALGSNTAWDRAVGMPFEAFGIFALLVLLILAATSHDFWLSFLTPPVWKALHMLIYPAYAAVVVHIAFGALQDQQNPVFAIAASLSAGVVAALHWAAATLPDDPLAKGQGWERVCTPADIREGFGRIARLSTGERVAVFRHQGALSAISNACAHQNGPLGEGRIIDGCVTCPWHGFQYRVSDGCSPPPFTEKVPTYALKIEDGAVWVRLPANPPGTPVTPVPAPEGQG